MHIDTAESGKQALEMVQRTRYHLIFMDHMMPGMDGVETTREIRKLDDDYYKHVPIIALSANALMDARKRFIEAGMDDFVAKPIEIPALMEAMADILNKQGKCHARRKRAIDGACETEAQKAGHQKK